MEKVEKEAKQMEHHMNSNTKAFLMLVTLIVVAILATLWAASFWSPRPPWERHLPPSYNNPEDIELFYTVETVISTINVTLAIFLLFTYVNIYRKTRSEFTIGLIIFSMVFLLNALASNPLVVQAFGFRPFGLGPFVLLPDLFTFVALTVLLYLSIKY